MGNCLLRRKNQLPIIGGLYLLGDGQSFNIKSLFPEHYSELTSSNFFNTSASCSRSQSQSPTGGRNPSFSSTQIWPEGPSYDSSTGILYDYINHWGRPGSSDGTSQGTANITGAVVFIPGFIDETRSDFIIKVHKIVDLGTNTGQTINLKSVCKKWKNIVPNINIYITGWSTASYTQSGGDHTHTVSTIKTYNNETGDLVCCEHSDYNGYLTTQVYLIY